MTRDDTKLMASFCSLGGNCEFGAAQRAHGAEPHDLLRWAIADMASLSGMLAEGFDGIGDDLEAAPPVHGAEIMVRSRRYGFRRHAWARGGEMPLEEVLAQAALRLPILAQQLAADLAGGNRIFVRIADFGVLENGLDRLLTLMRSYGPAPLLFVAKACDQHLAGTVEHVGRGLFRGYISNFADPTNIMATTRAEEWLTLCRTARELVGERVAA